MEHRQAARQQVVAARDIVEGSVLSRDDLRNFAHSGAVAAYPPLRCGD